MPNKYLKVSEVADEFNINEHSVRQWLRTGDLEGIRLGKAWRISRKALNEFITKSTEAGLKEKARVNFKINDENV